MSGISTRQDYLKDFDGESSQTSRQAVALNRAPLSSMGLVGAAYGTG